MTRRALLARYVTFALLAGFVLAFWALVLAWFLTAVVL